MSTNGQQTNSSEQTANTDEHVYITPHGAPRSTCQVFHTDGSCPRLDDSRKVARETLNGHFTEFKQCAGVMEQPETHRQSLRQKLADERGNDK